MRRILLLCAVLALTLTGANAEGESVTLTGEYQWTGMGSGGELEVVFTPTGDAAWDVDFHFTFRDKDHTYSGTAEGSLLEGKLAGTVQNEAKKRTFTFSGKFNDGQFSGTHAETTGGRAQSTGTLTLQN